MAQPLTAMPEPRRATRPGSKTVIIRTVLGASIVVGITTLLVFSAAFSADETRASAVSIVRAVLSSPEDEIDFAKAKLTFDKIVDPNNRHSRHAATDRSNDERGEVNGRTGSVQSG